MAWGFLDIIGVFKENQQLAFPLDDIMVGVCVTGLVVVVGYVASLLIKKE